MKRSLKQIAELVQARVVGDSEIEVSGISSAHLAGPTDLIFVEKSENLEAAIHSRAGAIIIGENAVRDLESIKPVKALIVSPLPRLAFSRAAKFILTTPDTQPGIHPSAVVHASVRLKKGVTLEEHVVIQENAEIGEGTRIAAHCVIGADVVLGRDCVLHSGVVVYAGARLGNRVIVHAGAVLGSDGFGYVLDPNDGHYEKFPQIGKLEIEDDVEIGANTTIDRGALEVTRIGRGTKIDNLVHIGHNCQIGQNVIVAAQAGLSGSIAIADNVVIGGQVGIGEHARIEEGVMLGGQSGVLPHKVLRGKGIAFWGTPARPLREYLKGLAALARLAKRKSEKK